MSKYSTEQDLEFDLKNFFNLVIRNKFIIIKFSFVFAILFFIYSLTKKNIWEGEFDIVVNTQSSNNSFSQMKEMNLARLNALGIGDEPMKLKTEVGILQSSSVLKPIFDYVNYQRKSKNPNLADLEFIDWKKNSLDFELKKGTSILNISYRDNDKQIINDVLKKISLAYQDYSGRNRRKAFENTKNYLNEQIRIYKIKTNESIRVAQKYGMEKDLLILDRKSLKISESDNDNPIQDNASMEVIRVNAANKIKRIDKQLKKINELGDDFQMLRYIGSNVDSFQNSKLPKDFESIETSIAELKTKYTKNDPVLRRMEEQRLIYIKLIKEKTIGFLKAEKMETEALMEAVERPKDVLLKYKELLRVANRDETTLINLENELRFLNLEKSKLEEPWELITNPTLLKEPVSLSKRIYAIFGLFLGSIFGLFFSFIKEKNSDLVYEEEFLESELESKIIARFIFVDNKIEDYLNNSKISFDDFIKYYKDGIIFIKTINIEDNFLEIFRKKISKSISKNNFIYDSAISKDDYDKSSSPFLLLASLKNLRKEEIRKIKNKFSLFKINLSGIIIINNE